jgi:hypothetical protein
MPPIFPPFLNQPRRSHVNPPELTGEYPWHVPGISFPAGRWDGPRPLMRCCGPWIALPSRGAHPRRSAGRASGSKRLGTSQPLRGGGGGDRRSRRRRRSRLDVDGVGRGNQPRPRAPDRHNGQGPSRDCAARPFSNLVEPGGFEPPTSAMPLRRSPN